MFAQMAKQNYKDELYEKVLEAKRDYDTALSRFNASDDEAMINLAVFDMNAAMKRYCCLIKQAAEN